MTLHSLMEAKVLRDADEDAADGKAKQKAKQNAKQNVFIKLGLAALPEFGEFNACNIPV